MKKLLGISALGLIVLAILGSAGLFTPLFSANYLPHRFCYLAQPGLIWTNVTADALIATSYALIFGCLFWITLQLRATPELRPYLWIFFSFGVFIAACGATHLMEVVTIWLPAYPFSATLKVLCAAASVPTAILFARVTPALTAKLPAAFDTFSKTQRERDRARADLLAMEAIALERERAEALVIEANERLNHILDSTSEGAIKLDSAWNILYGNRRAYEMAPNLTLGMNLWECFPALLGTVGEVSLRACMEERREKQYEIYYEPFDEWFHVRAYPAPRGMSIFYRTITAEKKLSEALQRERIFREKRIEALGNMAGGLAHEISNPLAIVHGTACDMRRLAEADALVPASEVLQASDTILKTSDRAIRILRGLRGFAREAANDPMEPGSVYEIVEQAVQLQEARFSRHRVELHTEVPEGLPAILCREVQIGQIVNNLLNNAFDAIVERNCIERHVLLQVRCAGQSLEVDVTDSGMGVDTEIREHLMDPFFTTKTRGVGMGIGLSLSSAIAHNHGGTLELLKDTRRTCFRLSLPFPQPAEPPRPAQNEEVS